jgi:hypothetical protein
MKGWCLLTAGNATLRPSVRQGRQSVLCLWALRAMDTLHGPVEPRPGRVAEEQTGLQGQSCAVELARL